MAVKKRKPRDLFADMEENYKKLTDLPIEETRWFVVDYYPAHRAAWHDEYNDWIDAKSVICSEYFDTEEEATEWMALYEPEVDAELQVRFENLRVFTESRWVNF